MKNAFVCLTFVFLLNACVTAPSVTAPSVTAPSVTAPSLNTTICEKWKSLSQMCSGFNKNSYINSDSGKSECMEARAGKHPYEGIPAKKPNFCY